MPQFKSGTTFSHRLEWICQTKKLYFRGIGEDQRVFRERERVLRPSRKETKRQIARTNRVLCSNPFTIRIVAERDREIGVVAPPHH